MWKNLLLLVKKRNHILIQFTVNFRWLRAQMLSCPYLVRIELIIKCYCSYHHTYQDMILQLNSSFKCHKNNFNQNVTPFAVCAHKRYLISYESVHSGLLVSIGVNATGDAGDTSPQYLENRGRSILYPPQKFSKIIDNLQ